MAADGSVNRDILRLSGGSFEEKTDALAVEKKLRILINGREAVSLFCTPVMVKELVAGFLMTEAEKGGWCFERMAVTRGDDIVVDVPAEGDVRIEGGTITSGCAGGITFNRKEIKGAEADTFSIEADSLTRLFGEFQRGSALYRLTGCVHSAALSDGKAILCFADDIGRHNAVDKVIGYCLLEGIDLAGKIMLATGRLSSEIVSKCARWGIPMVASRTAPTSLAVELAERAHVSVVGFVRGERLNVYSKPGRVRPPLSSV